MATAQKRGFRFPWGGDPQRDEPDAPSLSERLGTATDDLGRGPFDLEPAGEAATTTEALPDAEAAPAIEPAPAAEPDSEPQVEEQRAVTTEAQVAAEPARNAWPEADRGSSVRRSAVAESGSGAMPGATPASGAWPAPAAARSDSATARRDNPLVAGLVRAMREAARVAREEAVTSLRSDAVARGEAIRVQGTEAAAELRKAADSDVASIREWSKAEMTRIREATEARITARKIQLGTETEAAGEAVEALLGRLASTVEAFEAETAAFFDALLAEEDPARLAGLAEQMPQLPTLDEIANAAPPTPAGPAAKRVLRVEPPAPATGSEAVHAEPEALDANSAAAAEAEALAGLDGQTQLVVSGLATVAAIASFKATLVRTPGVSAVSATAGSNGDVLFTVTHADNADIREAIDHMAEFQARVIADDGSSLVVETNSPAA